MAPGNSVLNGPPPVLPPGKFSIGAAIRAAAEAANSSAPTAPGPGPGPETFSGVFSIGPGATQTQASTSSVSGATENVPTSRSSAFDSLGQLGSNSAPQPESSNPNAGKSLFDRVQAPPAAAPKKLSDFGALSSSNDPQEESSNANAGKSLFDRVEAPPAAPKKLSDFGASSSDTSDPPIRAPRLPKLSDYGALGGGTSDPPPPSSMAGRSLFDRVEAPPAAPKLSSFGALSGGSDPPPSSSAGKSLFDRVEAPASKPAQTSSVFDNTTSSAPQASNLFGNTTSQPQKAPNLFGGALSNMPAPIGLGTSSLFGQTQTQNQSSQQAAVGQGQDGTGMGKPSQIGYFDNLLEKGKKRQRESNGGHDFQELPSLQLNMSDIAKRARELVGGSTQGGRGADSSAHYLLAASGVNPGSTRRDLDDLASRQTFSGVPQEAGFEPDTHKYLNQLQQQSTLKMISEGLERAHRNFDTYLAESVEINWDQQRLKIYEHFGLTPRGTDGTDDFASLGGKGAFGKTSRKSRLGKSARNGETTMSRSIFGQSSMQKSVIGTPGKGSNNATLFADVIEKNGTAPAPLDDRFLRDKQRKYAEKVQILNQSRLAKMQRGRQGQDPFSVLAQFQALENQPGGDSPKQLVEAYDALVEIVGEGAKERQFADDYLDEAPQSAKSIKIRKRIINGSRTSLEKAFYKQLENLVAKNPREAQLGGVPTALNKIKAYIKIRYARKDIVPDGFDLFYSNGDYPWPIIYFCLRCGLVKEAADYVATNGVHFRTFDKNILTFLPAYANNSDRRLDRRLQSLCNNVHTSLSKSDGIDPYRVACYKIIGRCDLSKRSLDNISQGVEDWIWLQFNLAREVNRAEESAGDVFGMDEVRETIQEIGERHFAKGAEGSGGWGTFFYLQILGGMFEQAVAFLYAHSYMSAVHFAIGLDYYGLLRVSDFAVSETELLTHNTKELPQISFGRMIGYYTRDFRASNVEAAVDYLALICLNADLPGSTGTSQSALCHEALRELVLETREFARLLGDVDSRGQRIQGAIEQRLQILSLPDQHAFLRTITVEAASFADDNGRITDAVLLYQLAEDYDNVITVVNRALSEAIAVDIGQEAAPMQIMKPRTDPQAPPDSSLSLLAVDDPLILTKRVMQIYETNTNQYLSKIKDVNRQTCGLLVRLMEAKKKVAAGEWAAALDVINALGVLPFQARGSIPIIRASAQSFAALPTTVSRNIGPLLLWTITSIGRQRELLATKQFGNTEGGTNAQISENLLVSARDLMVFAGLLKYRLGERVWEALCGVSAEVGVA